MFWSGQSKEATCDTTLLGPFLGDYTKTVNVATTALVWSDCGTTGPLFNVLTSVFTHCSDPRSFSAIEMDEADEKVSTPLQFDFGLAWKKC